jgi:hypothetical protein
MTSCPGGRNDAPWWGTRERAFDHDRLARALTEATGTTYEPFALPLQLLRPTQDGRGLGSSWTGVAGSAT